MEPGPLDLSVDVFVCFGFLGAENSLGFLFAQVGGLDRRCLALRVLSIIAVKSRRPRFNGDDLLIN